MAAETLAEKVIEGFSKITLKKTAVKIPKLKARKSKPPLKIEGKMPLSALVHLLIKNALESATKEKKAERIAAIKCKALPEEKGTPGGYGTSSSFYGAKAKSAYVDYEKLFSYLGKFKAKSSFYSDAPTEALNSLVESKSFELVSREAMDKGARYVRFFFPKVADFYANLTSLVPVAGMSSAEWEQFKFMMKSDPAMYALKSKTA